MIKNSSIKASNREILIEKRERNRAPGDAENTTYLYCKSRNLTKSQYLFAVTSGSPNMYIVHGEKDRFKVSLNAFNKK